MVGHPRVTYSFNRTTGKYDVTVSVNLAFKSGTPRDHTAVRSAIVKHWGGVRGIYDVTVNLADPSAPEYQVSILTDPTRVHGEGRSFGPGRGGYMTLWSPTGSMTGVSSTLVGHEFGHASGIGYHEAGNSIMNDPPGSTTDPATVGKIMARCDAQRTDQDDEKSSRR